MFRTIRQIEDRMQANESERCELIQRANSRWGEDLAAENAIASLRGEYEALAQELTEAQAKVAALVPGFYEEEYEEDEQLGDYPAELMTIEAGLVHCRAGYLRESPEDPMYRYYSHAVRDWPLNFRRLPSAAELAKQWGSHPVAVGPCPF
jgi:hypothetical protein